MCFVDYQCRVSCKVRFCQELSQKHTIRHILEHCFVASAILEPDRIANLIANFGPHFLCDTCSNRHCSYATRLRTPNLLTASCVAGFMKVLWQLRRLSRTSFGHDNEHLMFFNRVKEFLAIGIDWERLASLLDRFDCNK